jgi:hypothetical protein
MNPVNFDDFYLIETNENKQFKITTLSYIAPKKYVIDSYPDTMATLIDIEFSSKRPYAAEATVMISPVDIYTNKYEWHIEKWNDEIIQDLIDLAMQKQKNNLYRIGTSLKEIGEGVYGKIYSYYERRRYRFVRATTRRTGNVEVGIYKIPFISQ